MALGFVLVVWSLTPDLLQHVDESRLTATPRPLQRGALPRKRLTLEAFRVVIYEDFWYLERFWQPVWQQFLCWPDGDVF